MNVDAFLEKFTCWAKEQSDIEGAALIGSYAGGMATENSDVDLMILTTSASRYLDNKEWLSVFGEIAVRKMKRGVWWKRFALSIERAWKSNITLPRRRGLPFQSTPEPGG